MHERVVCERLCVCDKVVGTQNCVRKIVCNRVVCERVVVDAEEAAAGRRRTTGYRTKKQEPHRKMWETKTGTFPSQKNRHQAQPKHQQNWHNEFKQQNYKTCQRYNTTTTSRISSYIPNTASIFPRPLKSSRTSPKHRSIKLVKRVFIDLGNYTFLPADLAGILKSGKQEKTVCALIAVYQWCFHGYSTTVRSPSPSLP